MAEAYQRTAITVEDFVRGIDPRVAIAIVVLVIVMLFRRR